MSCFDFLYISETNTLEVHVEDSESITEGWFVRLQECGGQANTIRVTCDNLDDLIDTLIDIREMYIGSRKYN